MGKKTFVIMLVISAVTFFFVLVVKYYQPTASTAVSFADLPVEKAGWTGRLEEVPTYVMNQLNPVAIFSANYRNAAGLEINLLVDYFGGRESGGPHSPRNCLPGSGWTIVGSADRDITLGDRTVTATRFALKLGEEMKVMDFWYVTKYGETADDYVFKLYLMASSLTLNPTDVAFVRFFGDTSSVALQSLDEFERVFVPEIYQRLPFNR